MIFKRFPPGPGLEKMIDCYWIARDESTAIQKEKIIPDGFTEIIFHNADPYRISMNGEWKLQSNILFAGQISQHFFLENTGAADIIGIKLRPTAFTRLYQLPIQPFSHTVVDISISIPDLKSLYLQVKNIEVDEEKITTLNNYFIQLLAQNPFSESPVDRAVDMIFEQHGMLQISTICREVGIGERQLENLFKKHVGLSPKLFARIIRFSYIFQLVQENNQSWCGLAYEAAYYDQSHFIRNFKNFTGENPADYAFNEENFANFFMNKK